MKQRILPVLIVGLWVIETYDLFHLSFDACTLLLSHFLTFYLSSLILALIYLLSPTIRAACN